MSPRAESVRSASISRAFSPACSPAAGSSSRRIWRLLRESACDREQPELPQWEHSCGRRGAVVEPDDLERLTRLPPHALLLPPLPREPQHALHEPGSRANVCADGRIVENVELLERAVRLEDRGETMSGPTVWRPACDVTSADANLARIHGMEAGDAPEER